MKLLLIALSLCMCSSARQMTIYGTVTTATNSSAFVSWDWHTGVGNTLLALPYHLEAGTEGCADSRTGDRLVFSFCASTHVHARPAIVTLDVDTATVIGELNSTELHPYTELASIHYSHTARSPLSNQLFTVAAKPDPRTQLLWSVAVLPPNHAAKTIASLGGFPFPAGCSSIGGRDVLFLIVDDGKYPCLTGVSLPTNNVTSMACGPEAVLPPHNLAVASDGTVFALVTPYPSNGLAFVELDPTTGGIARTIIRTLDTTIKQLSVGAQIMQVVISEDAVTDTVASQRYVTSYACFITIRMEITEHCESILTQQVTF